MKTKRIIAAGLTLFFAAFFCAGLSLASDIDSWPEFHGPGACW